MFGSIYKNRRVLVTGHTGFKGSYLAFWLQKLGAQVCGIGLDMDYSPSHLSLLNLDIDSNIVDIRNAQEVEKIFTSFKPEIVFHLAAQPLVRLSYLKPVETFSTNLMGTINILEACRNCSTVKAIVAISSDKCYENIEQLKGYTEEDPMGGSDPYSASKGAMEIVLQSYRRSFFNPALYNNGVNCLLASGRAGNVIGGGDWAQDRLVCDMMKAASKGESSFIRNPNSVRPFQHVLEPLSGYLQLGQKLLEGKVEFASGWNFGPKEDKVVTVLEAAKIMAEVWDKVKFDVATTANGPHEAKLLTLDCTKAYQKMQWEGVWSSKEAFKYTTLWYRKYYEENVIATASNLDEYVACAIKKGLSWTK
jgi:CDP-glucose 4,6-dehydratase